MAATRRSFFGFLFGAAAAVPALPKIVGAMGVDPGGVREIYRGVTMVRTIRARWVTNQAIINTIRSRSVLLDPEYYGVPIRVVDSLDDDDQD